MVIVNHFVAQKYIYQPKMQQLNTHTTYINCAKIWREYLSYFMVVVMLSSKIWYSEALKVVAKWFIYNYLFVTEIQVFKGKYYIF